MIIKFSQTYIIALAVSMSIFNWQTGRAEQQSVKESSAPSNLNETGLKSKDSVVESQDLSIDKDSELSDLLAYAAIHNPELKSQWLKWRAAVQDIDSARAFPDPKLSYSYYIENVETRVGPQEQKISLMQKFPWFGKRKLRGEKAAKAAEAKYQKYEQLKLNLFFKVKDVYYDYYYLLQAIEITRENIELLKQLESVARTQYEGGGNMSPVVRAQVELGKLEDRLQSLKDTKRPIAARLNATLNRAPDAELPTPESIPEGESLPPEPELRNILAQKNPSLKRLDALTEKADKAVDLSEKQYFPDVSLGVSYVDTGSAVMSGLDESGKDPLMAMVSINLPIWQSKYDADKHAAIKRREAAEQQHWNTRRRLESQLSQAVFKYKDAERKIDLYRDTLIPKAEQELNVSRQAFESGDADFLNLIDAERSLLQFKLSYEQARAERERQIAKIEKLIGKPTDTLQK